VCKAIQSAPEPAGIDLNQEYILHVLQLWATTHLPQGQTAPGQLINNNFDLEHAAKDHPNIKTSSYLRVFSV
jgi:hypothetical protein